MKSIQVFGFVTVALLAAADLPARTPGKGSCAITKKLEAEAVKEAKSRFTKVKRTTKAVDCECPTEACFTRFVTLAPFGIDVPKENIEFEVSVQVSLDDEDEMREGVVRIDDPPKPINFNDLARQVRTLLKGTDAADTALKCSANYGYRGFRLTCDRTEDVREDGAFARALTARVELETGKVTKY